VRKLSRYIRELSNSSSVLVFPVVLVFSVFQKLLMYQFILLQTQFILVDFRDYGLVGKDVLNVGPVILELQEEYALLHFVQNNLLMVHVEEQIKENVK